MSLGRHQFALPHATTKFSKSFSKKKWWNNLQLGKSMQHFIKSEKMFPQKDKSDFGYYYIV